MWIIVGLGNPGEGYADTRHNAGRMLVEAFAKKNSFPEWKESENAKALYTSEKIGKNKVELLLPETFMNKSGISVKYAAEKHKVKSEHVVVVYDELDIPVGNMKISFGRGSGGHKGVESVARSIKTKDFVRVRVGISPATPSGKLKKPKGDEQVLHFIMNGFSKKEKEVFKKISKNVNDALGMLIEEGRAHAMNQFN